MKAISLHRKTYASLFITIFATAFVSTGCWRSPKEVARFATAGQTYTTALDTLLVRCADIDIDSDSEFLLHRDAQANLSSDTYVTQNKALIEKLDAINRLRAHTKLLAHYFELLYDLSTSKAPQETGTALQNTAKSINSLGTALRAGPLFDANAQAAVSSVGQLFVTVKIRKELDTELTDRNKTIRAELVTQEELLKAIADDIQHNLDIQNRTREKRLVIDPLTANLPIAADQIDKWKANRKAAITASATIDDLKTASDAVKKLREAYEGMLNGKFDITRINDALDDLDIVISTSESLKKVTGDDK